ncbi:MAG: hypothetical protein HYZ27_08640, partial [Deltaproteobacteria bacterium]|nr:hypothetical protein [Deltaproteobacteria bacterium]
MMLAWWVAALALAQSETPADSVAASGKPAAEESFTLLRREVASRLLVDTQFEPTGEDVSEWWNVGKLSLDHRRGVSLRAFAEARVRWGVVGEDPGQPYLLVNVSEPKWTSEVDLREAFVSWRHEAWDIKVGQQIFVWGKNELFAAADLLNPMDVRYDPISGLDAFKDARAPVFAIDAGYFAAETGAELVVLPFFARHRAFL